jgi:signal transduction histidine kinase
MDADREALLGKSAVELGRALVSEGRIGRYREMLESVVSGTEQSKREVFTLDLPVGTRHVEFVASQQAGERGIEGAVCVARDVTDRVETERRLQRQNERLELLNHIVRHDIRHDMTIVSGWLSLLREDVPEETADRFDEVIRAAAHVIELTRAVGEALSVIEADEDISVKPTSLVETLEREVERARDVHPDAEIRVEGELPAVDVSANEMLASVFRNLLVNGITHADGDSPRVTLRAERVDDAVEVRVADEGPGLPEGLRSALESDDRSVADAPGVGVGLYLVEALVDAYGGRIRVEDGEEGSAFRVRLPIAAECTDP